jgi:tetratricopeptide (TPR) repeat protein
MKKICLAVLFIIVLAWALQPLVHAQSSNAQQTLSQYISKIQKNPNDNALREKIIRHVQGMRPVPTIPEEARRYFVKATTLQKGAKDIGGYGLAVNAYNEALLIAPWWPEAYYNLSLALEQSGRFDDAAGALKLYLLTNPGSPDVRAAQDRIYALEAKKEMAQAEKLAKEAGVKARESSPEAIAERKRQQEQKLVKSLDGAVYTLTESGGFLQRIEIKDGEGDWKIFNNNMLGHHTKSVIVGREFTGFTDSSGFVARFTISEDGNTITKRVRDTAGQVWEQIFSRER